MCRKTGKNKIHYVFIFLIPCSSCLHVKRTNVSLVQPQISHRPQRQFKRPEPKGTAGSKHQVSTLKLLVTLLTENYFAFILLSLIMSHRRIQFNTFMFLLFSKTSYGFKLSLLQSGQIKWVYPQRSIKYSDSITLVFAILVL